MTRAKAGSPRRRHGSEPGVSRRRNLRSEFPPQLLNPLRRAVRRRPGDILPRLELAEYYLRNDREGEILEALGDLECRYPFPDPFCRGYYNRLLAFGHAHRRQFPEAEQAARRGLEDFPDSLDFYFVLSYVHLSLRELDRAVEAAERYLALWKDIKEGRRQPPDFSLTGRDIAQLYNILASALRDRGEIVPARDYYETAIAADPGNHLPYINLSALLRQQGDLDRADHIVNLGLRQCRQADELRLLAQSHRQKATVTACMIVKDEEEMLPRCLDSIRHWVNEIVVVDTGSTDRTVEIAESYGARVFHQPWEGDFSKHRNHSIAQASSDWVFIIDADEQVCPQDVPLIEKVLSQNDYNIISINVFNVTGAKEDHVTFLPSIRFFRRRLGLTYEGIVHNLLVPPDDEPIMRAGIRLKHYGYGLSPEKMKAKIDRSKALLEKQIAADPDNAFALFNYAQLLRGEGVEDHPDNVSRILEAAGRALRLTCPDIASQRHIHIMAHHQLAWAHFVLGEYERAEKYCRDVLLLKPNYLDAMLLLGQVALRQGLPHKAEEFFRMYLDAQARYNETCEIDNIIILHPQSLSAAYYGLGLAAEQGGDRRQARAHYLRVFESSPGYADIACRLGSLALAIGDYAEAEQCFLQDLHLNDRSVAAALGLADLYLIRREHDKAKEYCLKAVDINPQDPLILAKYGQLLQKTGDEAGALEVLEKAASLPAAADYVLHILAEAYFGQQRFDDAAHAYERLLERGPETGVLLNDLGNCYYKTGRWAEAQEQYLRASRTDAPPAVVYRNLGLAQCRLQNWLEALESLGRYLDLEPDETSIQQIIGDIHCKLAQFEQALPFYEASLRSNPHDVQTLFSLSECYLHMGHTDSALMGYRRAVQIDPDFEPANRRLAELGQQVVQP